MNGSRVKEKRPETNSLRKLLDESFNIAKPREHRGGYPALEMVICAFKEGLQKGSLEELLKRADEVRINFRNIGSPNIDIQRASDNFVFSMRGLVNYDKREGKNIPEGTNKVIDFWERLASILATLDSRYTTDFLEEMDTALRGYNRLEKA